MTAWKWLAGTALLATAAGAAGQTTAAPAGTAEAPAADEIVVTAQKRVERLIDVPLTVSVVSAKQLGDRAITNLSDLQTATPELNYSPQPAAGYSIRGSGTQTFARSAENNVLLVIDGVVIGQLTPSTSSLFDIERAEVLSGPQGMLFGRNASAGVINITTRSPELGVLEGRATLSYGEANYLVAQGVINVPLGSTAALRVTASRDQQHSRIVNEFTDRRIGDRDNTAVRAKLRWEPTTALRIDVLGDYELERGGNFAWTARDVAPGGPIATALAACGVTAGRENTEVCLDGPTSREILAYGGSVQASLDLGAATLTSISAYRRFERDSDTDSDTRPINVLNSNYAGDRVDQYSQELRVASNGRQRLEYVAGLFYYDYAYNSLVNQGGTLGFLPFVATRSSNEFVRQRSFAVFGQATFRLTDTLSLIAGGRYTWDKARSTFVNFVNPALGTRLPGFTPADSTTPVRQDTNNFSYRLGAQYQPSRDLTFFATFSEGYKGPAFNNPLTSGAAAPGVVRPEYPRNIEAGVKAALLDGALRIDLSAYDMRVRDFQAQTVATSGGVTAFVFTNASSLRFRGAQLNATATPTRGLSFNLGALYNRATYGDFTVPCNAPFLTGCTTTPAGPVINARGTQLAAAPLWKITTGLSGETSVGDSVRGFGSANLTFTSKFASSPTPDPNLVVPAQTQLDARAGVRDADGRWAVSVFARNLLDERNAGVIFRDPLAPTLNYMQGFGPSAFRTVGVTLELGFRQ